MAPYRAVCLTSPGCGFDHGAANRSPLRQQRPRDRDRLYNTRPTWSWRAARRRRRIVALAGRHRFPLIAPYRDFPAVGGLMSYGTNIPNLYRQAAIYASRILKGEKPGDLPVMLPTKFELVINVKTAKTLGIEIPDR